MKRHRARLAIAAGVLLLVLGTGFAVGIREKARRLRDALTAARMHLERGQPHLAGKAYSDLLDTFGEVREARDGLERSGREAETRIHDLVQGATEDETLAREWNGPRAMAVRKLDEALSIRDDPSLRVRRDQAMGIFEVRIVSDPPGATVVLRPCRKATGEWGAGRTMGVTPLTIPIQEGLCRIDLDSPGLGYGEYTFDVGPLPSQRLLEVRIVRTEDALASMVPIPGGRYRLGQERTDLPAGMPRKELPPRMVDLEPFHLDRCEVSNRAYLEFVRQTGHRPAFNWKSGQPPFAEALADKPVTGVDWYDAQAYARWAGKRLPTAAEWEAACRGAGGALFPWGDKFDPDRANFGAPIPLEPGARVEGRPLQPVDGTTPDRTSLGVLHLMGNAQEWVWDPWVSALPGQEHGQWSASATARTVCGWSSLVQAPTEKECSCANRIPREPTDRLPRIGFRCAKSSRP
jgi:iron(II)-dependent oxidoreductase